MTAAKSERLSSAEQRFRLADHRLSRDIELLEEDLRRSRGAEALHANEAPLIAKDAAPALLDGRLGDDARLHRAREHRFAIGLVLHIEEIERGHAHEPDTPPLSAQPPLGFDNERELAPRGDEDELGLAALSVLQNITAALHARSIGVDAAIERRDVLPRKHEHGGAVIFKGRLPSLTRLIRIAGAKRDEVRDGAQRSKMLDRLMRRAVFAKANRIMREDMTRADPHQRREAERGAHIIAKDEEGRAEGDDAAMESHAVDGGGHSMLTDAPSDVPRDAICLREEGIEAFHMREV